MIKRQCLSHIALIQYLNHKRKYHHCQACQTYNIPSLGFPVCKQGAHKKNKWDYTQQQTDKRNIGKQYIIAKQQLQNSGICNLPDTDADGKDSHKQKITIDLFISDIY